MKEITGGNRTYLPLYKNFPQEVMSKSDSELFFNAIFHYWSNGTWEPSTVEFDKPVIIDGSELPAGKYALFTIPSMDKWTIIFNSDPNQWGAYKYDPSLDVLRLETGIQPADHQEQMEISLKDNHLNIQWEKSLVLLTLAAKG